MTPLFLMLFGGGVLLANKSKKKASAYKLVETGSMGRLPTIDQPLLTMDLRRGQMIEIITASSPAYDWVSKIEGGSVKVDRHTRMQDSVTQMTTFSIKALVPGDSRIIFQKMERGEIEIAHHIGIAVIG
jgi:hypothetical protein